MATERNILLALASLTTGKLQSLPLAARTLVRRMRALLRSRNVVGVGVAEKLRENQLTGTLALVFYVQKKLPLGEIPEHDVIPPVLPKFIGGQQTIPTDIPTDVVALGRLSISAAVTRYPIQPGFSIGHVDARAGTLGAIVTVRDGRRQVLSNCHVLAQSGRARIGDPVLYPGEFDGGTSPADVVARLTKFQKFKTGGAFLNDADCAVAVIVASREADVTAEIKGLGLPKGIAAPKRGMPVVKVGRATGKTAGTVRDVHFNFWMHYEGVGDVGFRNQVLCSRYAAPGDSGSLVLDQKTVKAVGLHFASAEGGSVFSPIDKVLNALAVELVTFG